MERLKIRGQRMDGSAGSAQLRFRHSEGGPLIVSVSGDWRTRAGLPDAWAVTQELAGNRGIQAIAFDTSGLEQWNTGLLSFLMRCQEVCTQHEVQFKSDTLPSGIRKLVELANAVPEKTDAQRTGTADPLLARLGHTGIQHWEGARSVLTFLGEIVQGLARMVRGRAQFRWSDAWVVMQECGPEALGIVALINFLVGLILAFVGSIQLIEFGASIYVADLVAIATVREMGCIMTGIILCGRTGAAFAAQLGTMKVNEEINALSTFGISPTEFLVLPRLLALFCMMPLLCVFADLIAIIGGYTASMLTIDITTAEYIDRTISSISLKGFLLGIFKGSLFGLLVALTGCLRGMQCGNSAAGVGQATTSAVVAGITSIIAADGIFAVICNLLNW